ncbi:unnamed protein product [Lactuca saligna]|uniref:Uncharacterized protein n=1 Tax=Lactuca saligna TaxID=75948 RepID=A0AA35YLV3_LACSI|nr:unnamed protein product [Lactuca saligna]
MMTIDPRIETGKLLTKEDAGVLIREDKTLVSPSTKKRRVEDMTKRISKKTKKTKKRQLVIPTAYSEDEEVPETPEAILIIEPSSPEKTIVIPPEVSSAKSLHEEVRTSLKMYLIRM